MSMTALFTGLGARRERRLLIGPKQPNDFADKLVKPNGRGGEARVGKTTDPDQTLNP